MADQRFAAESAAFSTIDLALLGSAETCPLCQANPPVLNCQTGNGGIRHEGYTCLPCACRILSDIVTREIGHWMTR
jgi:hypothetical protein